LHLHCLQAFNPVTVYVVSILTATEQPTLVSTLKVLIVCAGVAIAGYGDVSFSVIGVCLQLASSVMDSIRCVSLQRVLQANHIQVGARWLLLAGLAVGTVISPPRRTGFVRSSKLHRADGSLSLSCSCRIMPLAFAFTCVYALPLTLSALFTSNPSQVGPLVTLAHVAPFTMAALALPVVFFEGPKLVNEFDKWKAGIPMVVLSGLIASCLNFVVFKVIGLTSALTTSLTGVFKDWACILLAMYLYNTIVSSTQWLGYTVAISGLLW
jgi:hypothetical protein